MSKNVEEENLPENDHRVIGQKLDLFSVHEDTGAGLPLFHPNGAVLFRLIEQHITEKLLKSGYQIARTPHIYKAGVWKKSGHEAKYKENMFYTESAGEKFAIKPMNCPGHIYIYKHKSHSYRELPIRIAEFGTVYRDELSGVLTGLTRVRTITQDDAHIFCKEDQIESEVISMINFFIDTYSEFGLSPDTIELSTMPKKHLGDLKSWKSAEKALEGALKKNKNKYVVNAGDGAFYGPKIDFHVKDVLGRSWQLGTIQLDFNLPERFKLFYIDDKNKKKQVIMLHRAMLGAVERFMAILIENCQGVFPAWLAPVQVRIINMNDSLIEYAEGIENRLRGAGFRVDSDYRLESVGKKVREAEMQKIPFIIVIGDKEKAAGTLAVRARGQKPKFGVKFGDFVKDLNKQVESKK
ncbi:threonine--tRNA ligase [Candidatus Woesearchaeota archaeon]|nr:threonine--tRNA ligase [Candidatus Woesearchaeota archaeon]MBT4114575.1 threonine--tRNA ligase [Candidatus Woesearchaeota archaeon]MBT4248075.1 threonine--tRNA ligase [Candidatus Woesearchaeota archaeon]